MQEDDLDRRAWLRAQPSYGPAWDAAVEFGIARLLERLSTAGVEFVLVCVVAANLHLLSMITAR